MGPDEACCRLVWSGRTLDPFEVVEQPFEIMDMTPNVHFRHFLGAEIRLCAKVRNERVNVLHR